MSAILEQLDYLCRTHHDAIAEWFELEQTRHPALFYGSVDLRHSGYKLVPVDTNVFPAGFNNLSDEAGKRATLATSSYLEHNFPDSKRILVIPENHTRNQGYLDNVAALVDILSSAGAEVRLGRLDLSFVETSTFTASSGAVYTVGGMAVRNGTLILADEFIPDLVLVNNDLSSGAPDLIRDISQPVLPPVGMGWYRRRKSIYFAAYDRVAQRFAKEFGMDDWLIRTISHNCGTINFKARKGMECVALGVERVLRQMREKYEQYGISDEPYVFVKADSGTYGMGIMTASSGEDIYAANKKTRNKMDVIKEGSHNTQVIIQEGVPTIDRVDEHFAEPLVYLIDTTPVGMVWRVNAERSATISLNARGMEFRPVEGKVNAPQAMISKLAMLAAALEQSETGHNTAEIDNRHSKSADYLP
jgi:glutamate--cysteine ligase